MAMGGMGSLPMEPTTPAFPAAQIPSSTPPNYSMDLQVPTKTTHHAFAMKQSINLGSSLTRNDVA